MHEGYNGLRNKGSDMDLITQNEEGTVTIASDLAKAVEEISYFALQHPYVSKLKEDGRDEYTAAALLLSLAAAQCS
jgi:hypothetical protein